MSDFDYREPASPMPQSNAPQQRVMGSPLPVGGSGRVSYAAAEETRSQPAAPPPGRTLQGGAGAFNADGAMNLLRSALPFVQKLLPLLEGSLGSMVSNMLSPAQAPAQNSAPAAPAPAPQVVTVDLEPLENGLNELQNQHRELRGQFIEQNASLKRVEDQLEMVRDATDRNTLEQQELLEDLKTVGTKINFFVVVALALLAGSIVLNIVLYLHLKRVLP